jgi:RNA processing factor Prp31
LQDSTKNWLAFCLFYWISFIFLLSIGYRTAAAELDLSDILPSDVEAQVKEAAEISMGTEISEEDITNIRHLCFQVCLVELFRMRKISMSHVRI